VVNRPVVNEDPVARLIRDLRAEIARLKSLLSEKVIGERPMSGREQRSRSSLIGDECRFSTLERWRDFREIPAPRGIGMTGFRTIRASSDD